MSTMHIVTHEIPVIDQQCNNGRPLRSPEREATSDDDKKSQLQNSHPNKEKNAHQKSKYQFSFTASFWMLILVVFYLFMTSNAHSLDEVQPPEQQNNGKPSTHATQITQIQVVVTEKASVSSREHNSKWITKIFAHNWHDPYKVNVYKSPSTYLNDNPNQTCARGPLQVSGNKLISKLK
ncbi:hypothetical protein OS493_000610 [Desmophyllum pertusum]|uniref:Uncharacterized protein n=1 Tax=Desmophyllum pertusum TaxID=174260 RepID=A0A9X0A7C4_9CNID|nr:hypothetical protein OS493_000610 [Desmophyllum pertusum]